MLKLFLGVSWLSDAEAITLAALAVGACVEIAGMKISDKKKKFMLKKG